MHDTRVASWGSLMSRLRTSLETQLGQLVPYIHIPLLCLPKYYASNASTVLERAELCKTDYEQWVAAIDEAENAFSSLGPLQLHAQDLPSVHTFSPKQLSRIASCAQEPPAYLLGDPAQTRAPPPTPNSVLALQDAWVKYADTCISEWRMLTVIASVLFTCVSYRFSHIHV